MATNATYKKNCDHLGASQPEAGLILSCPEKYVDPNNILTRCSLAQIASFVNENIQHRVWCLALGGEGLGLVHV